MKIGFFVDGFNLYHSLVSAIPRVGSTKWLDIESLCQSFVPRLFGAGAKIGEIHYYSALAHHKETVRRGTIKRHRDYIKCLENSGVTVHLGMFNKKTVTCDECGAILTKHEEKKTDVAISVGVIEAFARGIDRAVIISGDTDLVPVLETTNNLFGSKKIVFAFPYNRFNNIIKNECPESFKISLALYSKHQLPDPYILSDGSVVRKPDSW